MNVDAVPCSATFALFAYNQERYIRESVSAALAQDFAGLEIILSDDCSTDRTFQIMSEMASQYTGPHTVRLNRNPRNLGLAGHLRAVSSMIRSEVVILAAGDDISAPDRVSAVVERFAGARDCFAVFSDIALIDDAGTVTMETVRTWKPLAPVSQERVMLGGGGVSLGASYAYRTQCFDWPWPYPEGLGNEDRILPLRAALLGRIVHVERVLVRYRLSAGGTSRIVPQHRLRANLKAEHTGEVMRTLSAAREQGLLSGARQSLLSSIYGLGQVQTRLTLLIDGMRLPAAARRVAIKVLKTCVSGIILFRTFRCNIKSGH